MKDNTFQKAKEGFTLIETIVAVTILMIAIVAPISLSANGIRASRDAILQLEATNLALEGIEVLHNIRSNDSAADATPGDGTWMQSIISECNGGCVVDVTEHSGPGVWHANAIRSCGTATCQTVLYNPSTGLYIQRPGAPGNFEDSPFTRLITVTGIDNAVNPVRQVRITSTVTFRGISGALVTVSEVDELYNWFPCLSCP